MNTYINKNVIVKDDVIKSQINNLLFNTKYPNDIHRWVKILEGIIKKQGKVVEELEDNWINILFDNGIKLGFNKNDVEVKDE